MLKPVWGGTALKASSRVGKVRRVSSSSEHLANGVNGVVQCESASESVEESRERAKINK